MDLMAAEGYFPVYVAAVLKEVLLDHVRKGW